MARSALSPYYNNVGPKFIWIRLNLSHKCWPDLKLGKVLDSD